MGRLTFLLLLAAYGGTTTSAPELADQPRENPFRVAFDTTEQRYAFAVRGDAGAEVFGQLADAWGRRQLVLTSASGSRTPLAPPGFVLPPVSEHAGPVTLTCWNELTGPIQPSTNAPDPRDGVALHCRAVRNGRALGTLDAPVTKAAGWLYDVVAVPGVGFRVVWYENDGPLVPDATDGDGVFSSLLTVNGFPAPRRVAESWGPSSGTEPPGI
jgi:hypothetical protein